MSPKRWFANANMTTYYDVANSVYPVTMNTKRCCSILDVGRHATKQSPRTSPDLCTPLVINLQWFDQRLCFEKRSQKSL